MNTSITAQITSNITKTYMLMGTFLILIMALGWLLAGYFNNPSILYYAAFFSIAMNVYAYWFSASIAISSAGAQPADPQQYAKLHAIIEKVAGEAGLPKPRVYVIQDAAPNAFATGRGPNDAVVAATTGILSMMSDEELEGVLAHEMGHVQNRDILVMTIAVVLVGVISVMAQMAMRATYVQGGRRESGAVGGIALIIAAILVPLAAQLMQLAVSRRREYLADATGAGITHHPQALASALEKIGGYHMPMQRASMTTAHLFISNPFGAGEAGKWVSGLFSTHPPIEERVRILRSM